MAFGPSATARATGSATVGSTRGLVFPGVPCVPWCPLRSLVSPVFSVSLVSPVLPGVPGLGGGQRASVGCHQLTLPTCLSHLQICDCPDPPTP